jgi:DNA modification methylase
LIEVGSSWILQGDVLAVLASLPDQSVHCCVTSPPYFGLRDYGQDGQIGLEKTPQEYVEKMVAVFREVRRVLRDDGTLWLNLGDSYAATGRKGSGGVGKGTIAGGRGQATNKGSFYGDLSKRRSADYGLKDKDLIGIPWRVALALQADGWYLRSDIIWNKPNPMPSSVRDRCTMSHEYIFMLAKSERYYYDADAIAEPLASASVERLSQANLANQKGSDRVPGKTNGNMKAVLKQDGTGNRQTTGFNGRYFGSDKPYTGQATKDYAKSGAQDASETKRRIVDRILAGEIVKRNKRTVWTVTTKPFKGAHFATFPPDLIEPCILAGCPVGGTVLDPFGGSGTTGLVADRHGRNAILIELNPEYIEIAKKRLSA